MCTPTERAVFNALACLKPGQPIQVQEYLKAVDDRHLAELPVLKEEALTLLAGVFEFVDGTVSLTAQGFALRTRLAQQVYAPANQDHGPSLWEQIINPLRVSPESR